MEEHAKNSEIEFSDKLKEHLWHYCMFGNGTFLDPHQYVLVATVADPGFLETSQNCT